MITQKNILNGHLAPHIEHPRDLNHDHVDPRILDTLWNSAWNEHTTYPLSKTAWLEANGKERVLPSIGECFVTADLLEDLYPGSAKLLVDVDDPKIPVLVPHYLTWLDAHKSFDTNDVGAFRYHASLLIKTILSGEMTLEQSPLSDITGSQFSPGSRIIFIAPMSEKYVNDAIAHLDRDRSFAYRKIELASRFNATLKEKHGIDIEAFKQDINNDRNLALIKDMDRSIVSQRLEI